MAEPNGQPKQRYRTCLDCKPKPDCMPASKITTVVSKRKLQRLRKKEKKQREREQVNGQQMQPVNEAMEMENQAVEPMNQEPIPNGNNRAVRLVSKLTHYIKNNELQIQTNKHGKTVVVWNRDVNAGRNIMYVGRYQLSRRKLLFIIIRVIIYS